MSVNFVIGCKVADNCGPREKKRKSDTSGSVKDLSNLCQLCPMLSCSTDSKLDGIYGRPTSRLSLRKNPTDNM